MRKILVIWMLIVSFVGFIGCSDDDAKVPDISFRRAYYVLPAMEALNVEVRLSEPATEDLTVTFDVTGTGEEGEDYAISAHEFIVKAGLDTAVVVITPLNNMVEGREICLVLNRVEGYEFGVYKQTVIPIEKKSAFTTSFFPRNTICIGRWKLPPDWTSGVKSTPLLPMILRFLLRSIRLRQPCWVLILKLREEHNSSCTRRMIIWHG